MPAGPPRKFKSAKALGEAIEHYFASISYTAPMTSKDGDIVTNDLGMPVKVRKFAVAPTVCGMCLELGIDRRTWLRYCDPAQYPEYQEVTGKAKAVLEGWLERELVERSGNVRGLVFSLQNNFNWKERKETEIGEETRKTIETKVMSMDDKLRLIEETRQMMEEDANGR